MQMNAITVPFSKIFFEAQDAGQAAMEACSPTPMYVRDGSQVWEVADGVCGFAEVRVYGVKLNTRLGKEMASFGFKKAYTGGIYFWVSGGGQSMTRKEAYANAFVAVLKKYGFSAYAESRMD
jgi:hypothetical protein